jgi:hypothetical protein
VLQPSAEISLWRRTVFKLQLGLLDGYTFSLLLLINLSSSRIKLYFFLCQVLDICGFEELTKLALFNLVIESLDLLEQPFWVFNLGNWIATVLQRRWDCDNFHYRTSQSVLIVVPVNNSP